MFEIMRAESAAHSIGRADLTFSRIFVCPLYSLGLAIRFRTHSESTGLARTFVRSSPLLSCIRQDPVKCIRMYHEGVACPKGMCFRTKSDLVPL